MLASSANLNLLSCFSPTLSLSLSHLTLSLSGARTRESLYGYFSEVASPLAALPTSTHRRGAAPEMRIGGAGLGQHVLPSESLLES